MAPQVRQPLVSQPLVLPLQDCEQVPLPHPVEIPLPRLSKILESLLTLIAGSVVATSPLPAPHIPVRPLALVSCPAMLQWGAQERDLSLSVTCSAKQCQGV